MDTPIRCFEDADLQLLIEIWRSASAELNACRMSGELRELENYTREYVSGFRTFVYVLDGKPEGFITLSCNEVLLLFVAPARQHQGLGKDLIEFVKPQFDRLKLKVHTQNAKATKFYQRCGFQAHGKAVLDSFGESQRIMWWRNQCSA